MAKDGPEDMEMETETEPDDSMVLTKQASVTMLNDKEVCTLVTCGECTV